MWHSRGETSLKHDINTIFIWTSMSVYDIFMVAYIWLPGTSSHLWKAFHLTKRWPPLAMPGYSVRLHFAHQFTVLTSWAMQNFWQEFGCKRSIMYWLPSDELIWEIDPALNPSFQSELLPDVAQVPVVCHNLFTGVCHELISYNYGPLWSIHRQVLLSWLILSVVAYLRHRNLEPTQVSTILTKEWPSHLTGPQRRQKHQVPASTAVSWGGGRWALSFYTRACQFSGWTRYRCSH